MSKPMRMAFCRDHVGDRVVIVYSYRCTEVNFDDNDYTNSIASGTFLIPDRLLCCYTTGIAILFMRGFGFSLFSGRPEGFIETIINVTQQNLFICLPRAIKLDKDIYALGVKNIYLDLSNVLIRQAG